MTDLNTITNAYLNLRNARSEARAAFEKEDAVFDQRLKLLEGVMLKHLNEHNMDSVRTEAGTFYRQEDLKPNITDDTAFYNWVREENAFDALERRVKKTFVKDYADQHGTPPPGISVHREYVVRVRKGNS